MANAPRQPLFARDFAQIKEAGFDHVRLPFDPTYYGFKLSQNDGNPEHIDFIALDRAIALAEQYNVPLILDIHPGDAFMQTLERHVWAEKEFVALWTAIAERYKNHGTSALIFELLNEPQYYKSEALWNKLAARTVAAIRKISPNRTLIIGAARGSDIDALNDLETLNDPHIIYAFHFYEPYMTTLQGIHMGFDDKMLRYFRNVPYPSSLASQTSSVYAPTAPNATQAQQELQDYIHAQWDAAHIAARIQVAQDWADAHHVQILCGEFGVLRNHIDAASRYRWIHDVRRALDAKQIGWEIYDYADIFGITVPVGVTRTDPVDGAVTLNEAEKGTRRFDNQALEALGLKVDDK
jgi:endoglucanase